MTPKLNRASLLLASLLGLTLASVSPLCSAADTAANNVAATVNGAPITNAIVDAYVKAISEQQQKSISRTDAINDLINQQLVVQDAKRQGLDKQPAVINEIQLRSDDVLASQANLAYQATHPVTSADIEQAYKELEPKIIEFNQELKARHILVKTEEEAKAIIAELQKGADFAQVAIAKSTGPSAKNGGDLGWFKPDTMVAEFNKALSTMKKGEISAPVHTQFGWHVIKLEDKRHPTLEQMAPQLNGYVQQKRFAEYVASLKAKAQINK
ncbi:peptidylprolyl isomerase [Shewanella avicenniae]|uniref:peptidylprolyl isomerase n=1 Tax=Shewanella avicenniae TaxID=2814294 RepID=A0ABX7QRT9_9GAMM|nr:peptidylprolyl isomerase [Shewanella avicenniae]QSX34158.1 peptidylprolyl isomerase [Shewanella avicenniae]